MQWTATGIIGDNLIEEALRQLLTEHGLIQTAVVPTRLSAFLDFVFVTNHFNSSTITNIPPVANSDHETQLFMFKLSAISCRKKTVTFVQNENVAKLLSQIDWHTTFSCSVSTDDFANVFTNLLYTAVNVYKWHKQCRQRERLPRYIVQMLRKERTCVVVKQTHNYTNFKNLSQSITAAIRQHCLCKESRLIFVRDRKSFFSYIYNKSNSHHDLQLNANNVILSDADAANALLQEFNSNFLHCNQRINNCQLNLLMSASLDYGLTAHRTWLPEQFAIALTLTVSHTKCLIVY